MITTRSLGLIVILCFQFITTRSQSDTSFSTQQALLFADSLVKANYYQNWNVYESLSCPSAIKYYGGKDGFHEHIVEAYYRNEPKVEEKPETVKMVTIMNDNIEQWQCVIEKIRDAYMEDSRKAKVYTYLVGQSLDNGKTWKFIDVSHNNIENVIYIMPDIFTSLAIPERKLVYDDQVVAEENKMPRPPTKKKTTKKS